MKRVKQSSAEEIAQATILRMQRSLEDYLEMKRHCPNPPTRFFKKGDRVVWGAHTEVYIEEVLADGYIYLLRSHFHQDPKSQKSNIPDGTPSYSYQFWAFIFPYRLKENGVKSLFSVTNDINLQFYQQDISGLIHTHYQGIDYTPEYQRDYVWDDKDKEMLIDSIMNNISIGSFVFVRLPFEEGKKRDMIFYEILDGKQRMKAIVDFYEDRFRYKGKLYSELPAEDRWHFEKHPISRGELPGNSTREQILRTFVKLNTAGKVMDQLHLSKVKKEWEEEVKNQQIKSGIACMNKFENDENGNIYRSEEN